MKKVAVLGFGSWGIALSLLLNKNGSDVMAWQRSPNKTAAILKSRECLEYLPGTKIPSEINVTSNIAEAVKDAWMIVITVGSKATRETAAAIKPFINEKQIVLSASKGLELDTRLRLSQVISQILPNNPVAVISGPCHAEELVRGTVSTYVASSTLPGISEKIQDAFMSPEFRVYTNSDITGVELGGALKNIIALATGIADGLGFGDNTKAAIMTRGIVEISRLGMALGANPGTFSGLTGIGDLIVTCTSNHSRNRRAGVLIGQGKTLKETLDTIHMLVEGVGTAKVALELANELEVAMPITEEVNNVLFNGGNPKNAVETLMSRQKTSESESLYLLNIQ